PVIAYVTPAPSSRATTSLRNSCSKAEPPEHLPLDLFLAPVGMLVLHPLADEGPGQFIETKADLQALLGGHAPVALDLRAQPLVRGHGPFPPNRRRANASAPWTTTSSPSAAGTMS